jgi:methionyl aminopeptidase
MAIAIRNIDEINIMREGGKVLYRIVEDLKSKARAGISTYELDQKAFDLCKENNVKPAFLHYRGYPSTLCVGVNDVVVHGIPSKNEILTSGDIISIDMGVIYKEFYTDMAVTVGVGEVNKKAEKLMNCTKECLESAILKSIAGNTIGDIGYAIQSIAELSGFNVVRQMVGHGIGRKLHENPQIPGFGSTKEGVKLREGMTLAIEAIINEGDYAIKFLKDGWTTKTADGSLSALFEHTIVVKEDQAEIMTDK